MEHGGSEKDALLNSNNGHVQDKSNMEPVAGDAVEEMLKDKSKKKVISLSLLLSFSLINIF